MSQPIISSIEKCINIQYMDTKNITSIIYQYSIDTQLMKEWKAFCIKHSIIDHTNGSTVLLINAIKYPNSEEYRNIIRHVPIDILISELSVECKEYLLPYLLQDYDFKYFKATLIYSLNVSEDDITSYLRLRNNVDINDGFDYESYINDPYYYPDEDFYNRSTLLKSLRTILVDISSKKHSDGLPLLIAVLEQCSSFKEVNKEYYQDAITVAKELFEEETVYENIEIMDDEFMMEDEEHIRNVLEEAERYMQTDI